MATPNVYLVDGFGQTTKNGVFVDVNGIPTFVALNSNGQPVATALGVASGGSTATILVSGNITITSANAATYNGQILEVSGAYTITLSVGLPTSFGFAYFPPATGTMTIASDGTTLLNGATTAQSRTSALTIGSVSQRISSTNSYVVV